MRLKNKQLAKFLNSPKGLVTSLFVGLILLSVAWISASNGEIVGLELNIFRFFNGFTPVLAFIFLVITLLGTFGALLCVCVVLLMWHRNYFAMQVFIAGSAAWLAASMVKILQVRDRPYEILSAVHVIEGKDYMAGFPSAHSALVMAVAFTLLTKKSWISGWLIVLAVVLVGASRMVVGVHAPMDVVGGFGLGIIIASVVNYIFIKLHKVHKKSLAKKSQKNGKEKS